MQFLYQEIMFLFTMIMYCVTQRTQFHGMESLFTQNESSQNSYPLNICVWPANITATEVTKSVSLLYVIQDCSQLSWTISCSRGPGFYDKYQPKNCTVICTGSWFWLECEWQMGATFNLGNFRHCPEMEEQWANTYVLCNYN